MEKAHKQVKVVFSIDAEVRESKFKSTPEKSITDVKRTQNPDFVDMEFDSYLTAAQIKQKQLL